MTYNILAQNLLDENSHLYFTIDGKYLNWDYRKNEIIAEIIHYSPDVSQ